MSNIFFFDQMIKLSEIKWLRIWWLSRFMSRAAGMSLEYDQQCFGREGFGYDQWRYGCLNSR